MSIKKKDGEELFEDYITDPYEEKIDAIEDLFSYYDYIWPDTADKDSKLIEKLRDILKDR